MCHVRLVYVSRMTPECDTLALQQILEVSRRKNEARDITGVLCYDPTFFMQCLEGPRAAVNELYAEIVQDSRHKDVTLLEYCDVRARQFADWSMAFLKAADLDQQTLRKHGGSERFDPYSLSAEQARDFLVEIVGQERERLAGQVTKRD